MITQNSLIAGTCVASLAILVCVVFDYKRRNSPGYKKKLAEKRKRTQEAEREARRKERLKFPNTNNPTEVTIFFLNEVEQAEEFLGKGDIENGVIHMGNAVAMCRIPEELLRTLEFTLAPHVYPRVVKRYHYVEEIMKEDLPK